MSRGPDAYRSFHNALHDEYDYLAKLLDKTCVSEEDVIKSNLATSGGSGVTSSGALTPRTYRSQSPRPPSIHKSDSSKFLFCDFFILHSHVWAWHGDVPAV